MMTTEGELGRWAEAANWAAANRLGPSAIAERYGGTAADVVVSIAEWWSRHPEQFTVPEPVVPADPSVLIDQCSDCGVWFGDATVHRLIHRRRPLPKRFAKGGDPRPERRPQPKESAHGAVSGTTARRVPGARIASPTPARAAAPVVVDTRSVDWASLVQRAEREFTGTDGIARWAGVDEYVATAALGRLLRAASFSAPVGLHERALRGQTVRHIRRLQCAMCGLWFVDLEPHLLIHGLDAASYRTAFALAPDSPMRADDSYGRWDFIDR